MLTTFLGLAVPLQVTIITASIGSITIILNTLIGKANLSSLKQRRYIDTISKERIEWINKIRDSFVEFSMLTTEFSILHKLSNDTSLEKNHEKGKEALLVKIYGVIQKTNLLLNPTETYAKNLRKEYASLIIMFEGNNFNKKAYSKQHMKIENIQQIILKAEWKRTINEIELGKKLLKSEVDKIFSEVANGIEDSMLQDNIEKSI